MYTVDFILFSWFSILFYAIAFLIFAALPFVMSTICGDEANLFKCILCCLRKCTITFLKIYIGDCEEQKPHSFLGQFITNPVLKGWGGVFGFKEEKILNVQARETLAYTLKQWTMKLLLGGP